MKVTSRIHSGIREPLALLGLGGEGAGDEVGSGGLRKSEYF